jgi:putative inorganic carbon (hco3(-)) transporter
MDQADNLLISEVTIPGQDILVKYKRVVLLLSVILIGIAVGSGSAIQPVLIAAGVTLLLFTLSTLLWPDLATLAVIFLLGTNAATIAVKFHDVPYIIGAAFPGLLIIPLISYLLFRRQKLIIDPVFLLLLVYLAVQLLSTLFSRYPDIAVSELTTFFIEWMGIHFLVVNTVRTQSMLRRVVWVLVFVGIILGGVPLFQQITGTYENQYGGFAQTTEASFRTGGETLLGEIRQPRLAGAIGEKNYYAQIMLMLVPLGLSRFWGERALPLRLLGLAGAIVASMGMVLGFSRGAAVGFALMLIILLFLRLIKLYQLAGFIVVAALVITLMPQYTLRLLSLQSLTSLFSEDSGAGQVDSAISGRATEMLAAYNVFKDHPILGVGPGQFKYYSKEYGDDLEPGLLVGTREAHSLYLGIASELGIPGILTFMAILFVTLRNLYRTRHKTPSIANLATAFMLVIISFMTTGIFLHLSYVRYFALMLALASVASIISPQDPPPHREASALEEASSKAPILIPTETGLQGGRA